MLGESDSEDGEEVTAKHSINVIPPKSQDDIEQIRASARKKLFRVSTY